jgi:hypothetical protein
MRAGLSTLRSMLARIAATKYDLEKSSRLVESSIATTTA